MPYVTVEVEVEINETDWPDDVLVEEVESRGYIVFEKDENATTFTDNELLDLRELLEGMELGIGTDLYFLREKLVKPPY